MKSIIQVSKIEELELSSVFGKEDAGFTPWLCDNIDRLGDAVGISMTNPLAEQRLDTLRPDIIASTSDDEQIVIIENQYQKSDSYHLGKLISYAAYKKANYAILVTESVKEEHQQAVRALNRCNYCQCLFFIVTANAYKIGNSLPAVKFRVVEQPEDYTIEKIKEREKFFRRFWSVFIEESKKQGLASFENLKPSKDRWMTCGSGISSCHYNVAIRTDRIKVELVVYTKDIALTNDLFDRLYREKTAIETAFGDELDWKRNEDNYSSVISKDFTNDGGYLNEPKWKNIISVAIEGMKRLQGAFSPYMSQLRY